MNSESSRLVSQMATSTRTYQEADQRIDRLEGLVERLANQVSSLATAPGRNSSAGAPTCEHCHKRGHSKNRCFKLMSCNKCSKVGHIAKFCKEINNTEQSHSYASETGTVNMSTSETENTPLPTAPRIILSIHISNQMFQFLYDPGSMYTMIPRSTYDQLSKRPPLCPVSRCGVGVSNQKFKIDGVAHLNLTLKGTSDDHILLNYEPVLVSSEIKTCIFGIHSENQFDETKRSQKQNLMTFRSKDGKEVNIKFYREISTSCAFIEVCKSTVIENDKLAYITGKIKGI